MRALVARASRPDRLYPVKSNQDYGFYAGRLEDSRQALVTLDIRLHLDVFLFDTSGDLIGSEERDLAGFWPTPDHGYPDVDNTELHDYLRREFGFEPTVIEVKRFSTKQGVEIWPLPNWLQQWVADPGTWEDQEFAVNSLRDWVENEAFVLLFGNDYFLNAQGEVFSS
jgi:hypothetical protein